MSERIRVVVTGMGAISPLGNSVAETWKGLIEGKSGLKRISHEEGGLTVGVINKEVDIAGIVENFEPTRYFSAKDIRRIHRSAIFSYATTLEALKDANLLEDELTDEPLLVNIDPKRIGMRMGTGIGGGLVVAEIEDVIRDKGEERISPFAILQTLSERVVTVPSIKLGIRGPTATIVAACASGATAIGDAFDKIRTGRADVMIAGGVEAPIHRVSIGSFNAMHALSTDNDTPTFASRPFNNDVNGFVMGEGGGVLILERLDHALARGAPNIYAELVGFAETSDAHHDTQPSGEGAARAIRLALEEAKIQTWEVDYINAHGTSTPTGDETELDALIEVFGEQIRHISISSTKSATGHLLGGAGGIEAVICVKAINTDLVPPTLNLYNPIKELDLVPHQAKARRVEIAMSNSFGFGGINAELIFRKYNGQR